MGTTMYNCPGTQTSWPMSLLTMWLSCTFWALWFSILRRRGMYEDYLKVFFQQEKERVIEEIFVFPRDFRNYMWMPHWPIFKTNPVATTKIGPVFNCSLKTGKWDCLLQCKPDEWYAGLAAVLQDKQLCPARWHLEGVPNDPSWLGGRH